MKKRTLLLTIIGLIIIVSFCTSCTRTKSLSEIPSFKIDSDSLQRTFNSIIRAENVNISVYEKKSIRSTTKFLEIDILNGNNIPSSTNDKHVLSKKIASFIKHALKNENDYQEYLIKYKKKSNENSIVSVSSYVSIKFRNDEL